MPLELFANPLFVWCAAVLAAVPLIIHILNRRRHRHVPWAAMAFLLAANRRSASRTRLEHFLLLLVRTIIVVLLALTLARPRVQTGLAPDLLAQQRHHVIIMDNSASMQTLLAADTANAREVLIHGIERAQRLIQELPEGDAVTLMTLAYPARVINAMPVRGRGRTLELLTKIEQSDTTTDLGGTIQHLETLLANDARGTSQTIHLLSDCAGDLFNMGTLSSERIGAFRSLATTMRFVVHNLSAGHPHNVAITDLRIENTLATTGRLLPIEAVVHNTSTTRSPQGRFRLQVDGKPVAEVPVGQLDPDEARVIRVNLEFEDVGLHALEAHIDLPRGNALAIDDVRRLVLDVRERLDIVVVDGKPTGRRMGGHAGFIATAIAPGTTFSNSSIVTPRIVTEAEFGSLPLDEFAAVILCNVRRLETEDWQRVMQRVEGGAGLIIFMGDLVDLAELNKRTEDLIPAAMDGYAFDEVDPQRFVRFDPESIGPELSAHFAGRKTSGLFLARVHQYVRFATSELSSSRTVLAYDNGDPAIITAGHGRGRVIVVGTTANMDWTNLPAKGDFVTLAMDLLRTTIAPGAHHRNLVAGDPLRLPGKRTGTAKLSSSQLVASDNTRLMPEILPTGTTVTLDFGPIPSCGWHTLTAPDEDGPLAVNVPDSESVLASAREADIERILETDIDYIEAIHPEALLHRAATGGLALAMIVAVLALLFIESFVALLFGHHRK
jgi:hypothetical protein